jgi:hypothetical protein
MAYCALLDAEYPDELSRGLGIFLYEKKSCLTNLQRETVMILLTTTLTPDLRSLPAHVSTHHIHPVSFARTPSTCHGARTRKQQSRKQPPLAATALLSPRRLSPGRARTLALTNGALAPLSRPPPRLPRRHLHRPFRCGNERPPSTHSPFPTATSYSQILRARARALS